MIYTKLDKLDKKISRLGFGCMRFPMLEDGKIDREAATEMIDLAYKSGVNYFDTAYGYHNGESQVFTGDALKKYPRDSFFLANKLPTWLCKNTDDVLRLFNEQLEKCGVDYFDFYLLHALDKNRWQVMQQIGGYELLLEQKKQGKIGALGFSYHGDFDTFCEVVDAYPWDFAQIQINYVDYKLLDSKAYHDKLTAAGVPCVVMEPVRGGFLANLPDDARAELDTCDGGKTPSAAWALRWCLYMDNMPITLSGMSTLEQVRQNIDTFSNYKEMTPAELSALARARERILAVKTIPCTGCGYCMDCSFGVDIPGVFEVYNQYKLFGNAFRSSIDYNNLGKHTANSCTACGACAPMCPQGIDIPNRLAQVDNEMRELKF